MLPAGNQLNKNDEIEVLFENTFVNQILLCKIKSIPKTHDKEFGVLLRKIT
jgi:hypothetical protein